MKFAYADPPYLGCGRLYAKHHPEALIWDDPETHRELIVRLCDEYPDGWALSCHTPSLQTLLPMCPTGVRIGAWVKPFHAYKKGVRPAYAWEPRHAPRPPPVADLLRTLFDLLPVPVLRVDRSKPLRGLWRDRCVVNSIDLYAIERRAGHVAFILSLWVVRAYILTRYRATDARHAITRRRTS